MLPVLLASIYPVVTAHGFEMCLLAHREGEPGEGRHITQEKAGSNVQFLSSFSSDSTMFTFEFLIDETINYYRILIFLSLSIIF